MLYQFHSPKIRFGWDALQALRELQGARAAIISDKTLAKLGSVERAQTLLAEAGMESATVGWIEREPHTEDIPPLVEALRAQEPDWVIALGGGSVMDAAKAAWAFYEYPDLTWAQAFTFEGLPTGVHRSQFVAIPTTSGSGSEVSRVAVLIAPQTRLKRLIMSGEIVPTLAIVDPALAATMPPAVTAQSGLDALTHAIEAVVAQTATEFSTALALRAIRLLCDHLPDAYRQGQRAARENVHAAATLASMAASNSTAGLVHAMDQVGPLLGLPHGLVCAILLPYTLAFNLEAGLVQYAEMGATIGVGAGESDERARGFLRRVVALERELELPPSFAKAGVEEGAYFGSMDTSVAAVLESRAAQLSPRMPTAEQAETIFTNAYWGEFPTWMT